MSFATIITSKPEWVVCWGRGVEEVGVEMQRSMEII